MARTALFVFLTSIFLSAPAAAQDKEVAALSWLAGCWAADGAEVGSVEHWLAPAGGTMFGISRTVKDGVTVAHELMQIRIAQKKLVFIASPSGQAETTFTLLKIGDAEVSFENGKHDFPQRVIYRKLDKDRLLGRIEGLVDGKLEAIDFPMKRTACD